MEVVFIAVAEAANVSDDNHLNLLGVIHSIPAVQFPHRIPTFAMAFTLGGSRTEVGKKKMIAVSLTAPHEKKLLSAEGDVTLSEVGAGGVAISQQIIQAPGIAFPSPGVYEFRVDIEGKRAAGYHFRVVEVRPDDEGSA